MKRRQLLGAIAGATATGLSGCSSEGGSTPTPTPKPDNPWEKLPITVGLNREVSGARGSNEMIQEALTYWEENAEVYAGFPIEFTYNPNSDDADIMINVVEEISECGSHDTDHRTVGCAPRITGTPPATADVRIVADLEGEHLQKILKHEIGHTLGLDHDAEPQSIMSNDPELRIPNYEDKKDIVDSYHDGIDQASAAADDYEKGQTYYEDRNFEEAIEKFNDAANHATEAMSLFESAETTALGIDEEKVADICGEARQKSLKYEQSMTELRRAAEDYANEDYDQGDKHVDEHQKYHQEMRSLSIRDSEIIIDELDL